jgi:uncharacterized protein YodC (DUF2158 family)
VEDVVVSQPSNYYAPDGFRYGMRFRDGSVAEWWNGRTQRARAFEAANRYTAEALDSPFAKHYRSGEYLVVRRSPGGPWHVVCEYAEQGAARCSPAICDCFYDEHPDDPFGLHPEAFTVT